MRLSSFKCANSSRQVGHDGSPQFGISHLEKSLHQVEGIISTSKFQGRLPSQTRTSHLAPRIWLDHLMHSRAHVPFDQLVMYFPFPDHEYRIVLQYVQ